VLRNGRKPWVSRVICDVISIRFFYNIITTTKNIMFIINLINKSQWNGSFDRRGFDRWNLTRTSLTFGKNGVSALSALAYTRTCVEDQKQSTSTKQSFNLEKKTIPTGLLEKHALTNSVYVGIWFWDHKSPSIHPCMKSNKIVVCHSNSMQKEKKIPAIPYIDIINQWLMIKESWE